MKHIVRHSLRWLPLLLGACATIPVTGRKSFNIIPESQEIALGIDAYQQVLKTAKISKDTQATALVRRVGQRLAEVSDRPDYQWEYTLIDDPKTVNAFCLPGGKVAVYTGILPVTKTETGLAVVLSHEIAHAVANHGAERMSSQMVLSLGAQSIDAALREKPAETRQWAQQAFGIGATLGAVLPFGRMQESEADLIGLAYMKKAGYDPREAIAFWERMEASSGGQSPPEFLSTHPNHGTRINNIKKWLAENQP